MHLIWVILCCATLVGLGQNHIAFNAWFGWTFHLQFKKNINSGMHILKTIQGI